MGWKVLVTARGFEETPDGLEILQAAGCEVVVSPYAGGKSDRDLEIDALIAILANVDAVIWGGRKLDRDLLEKAPLLKVISRRGVGYENVDIAAARERNILVATTAGTTHEGVADHVFGLLLAAARKLHAGQRVVDEGRWEQQSSVGLSGKTIGIVGLGSVGKAVARRATGFAMKIVAYTPTPDDAFAEEHGVRYVTLDELLSEADFISISASANPKTSHMIDERAISKMKPAAILVNTARGSLVDENALAAALREGRIAAAAVDVFEQEPPVNTPLRGLSNAVLTPHSAGNTAESRVLANVVASETVVNFMRGVLPSKDRIAVVPSRPVAST